MHLPNTATVEEVAEVITADGVCIVDRLADDSVMDAIEAELRVHIDASRGDIDPAGDFQPRRTGALLARSTAVRELVTQPLVLGTVERVLEGDGGYQLHLTEVITVDPGGDEQFVHRDHWVFGYPWPAGQEVMCNTLWALTPFTEANGATRLIPGSNHFDDGRIFESSDTIAGEMERGSLLIYTVRCTTAVARTGPTRPAVPSTSPMPDRGYARRRTSTCRSHWRSPVPWTTTCCDSWATSGEHSASDPGRTDSIR